MKLMAAAVTFSAAMVKSPSFSRSSSSHTMIIWPARMAATASSIDAKGDFLRAPLAMRMFLVISLCAHLTWSALLCLQFAVFQQCDGSGDVLANHVAFDVHAVTDLQRREGRVRPGERDDHHVEYAAAKPRDRQADAVHGN